MKYRLKQPSIIYLLFTALILTACSPAVAQVGGSDNSPAASYTERGEVASAADTSGAVAAVAAATAPTNSAAAIAPNTTAAAFDKNGVEVGFTAEGRPYRGNPNAPVVIHEYSDYQCPFCARFAQETMPGLLANQIANGEAVLIFYDYPLTSIHPQAVAAANAARCAGEQGAIAYWEMHDALFHNISEWGNGRAETIFSQYAATAGLDLAQFDECQASDRYHQEILAEVEYGVTQGVRSTPSFFINSQPLIGAQPLSAFNQAITAVQNGGEIAAAQPEPTVNPALAPTPAAISVHDVAAAFGDPAAAVTLVEYTDYQCPYCARYALETLPQIMADMVESGRVYYVVKDFPLDNIHPTARLASVAARCAGEQDAYGNMHDALFAQQQSWSGQGAAADQLFSSIAASLGLETDAFDACLSSGKYDSAIEANLQEGVQLGVRGTPAFFVDGFPISGAQPYDLFAYAVELAEAGTLADAYTRPAEPTPAPTPSGPAVVNTNGAYGIGDPDAPVTIVEFTDFQCPFCARHFQQTYPQIKANYIDKGLVYYVFKEFPLTSIHPQAALASEAARCAGSQGAYVEMHDTLFAQQQEWSGRSDAAALFAEYAATLGLEPTLFTTCLESHAQETAVYADLNEGVALGVNGTPAFFINGYFLNGAQPYSAFQEAIEYFLSQ